MLKFSEDIGVDLGTTKVLIYVRGKGIVLSGPSVVAINRDTKEIKAVGDEAKLMLGRTPGSIVAVRPMKDGVIADYELTEKMLTMFINKARTGASRLFKPRIMVCIPSGVTDVEKRAVLTAVREAGGRQAYLIEEPLAAALGAGISIDQPHGSMLIDVGGGTTDIAIISMRGIVVSDSLRVAGNAFDEAIMRFIRREYNLMIGDRTAEEIKLQIGAAVVDPSDPEDNRSMEIRGRDQLNGLPKSVAITTADVVKALQEPVTRIVSGVRAVLERTPPELVSDIIDRGIIMTGGGSLLRNFDELLRQVTQVPVTVAEDPVECVALGTGKALDMIPQLRESLISSEDLSRR